MSSLIFGVDPKSLEEEWREEGLTPIYGSIENDLMIQAWEQYHDPVSEFKRENLYHKLKTLVHSHKISGTFYSEDDHSAQLLDTISLPLTRWVKHQPEYDGGVFLKMTCEGVPGLTMRDEIILGECTLTVVSRSKEMIEVRL